VAIGPRRFQLYGRFDGSARVVGRRFSSELHAEGAVGDRAPALCNAVATSVADTAALPLCRRKDNPRLPRESGGAIRSLGCRSRIEGQPFEVHQ
jgi:hypothetical protein